MKSIAIVTDSNCGMSPTQVKDLGIYMLPMPFFIDDKEYLEDIDMNQSEFFQHLEQNPGCRVSTSQPTPESVTTLWDKLLKDYDEIVHIPMSSGLSSSMQTARMLAEDYDGRVRVVNNQRISGTLRYSAIEAIQQAKNGLSADEIGTWLEKTRFDSSIYITVATLKYLKQGGRITPAAAALGTMLRLKPVLQIQGEKLDAFSKARTMTQAKSTMTKAIKDDIADRFGEKINLDVIHSHNLEAAEEFRKEVLTTFPNIGEVNIFPLLPHRPRKSGTHLFQGTPGNMVKTSQKQSTRPEHSRREYFCMALSLDEGC